MLSSFIFPTPSLLFLLLSLSLFPVAVGAKVAGALSDLFRDLPKNVATLKARVTKASNKKLIVKKKEMFMAKEDVEITDANDGEMASKIMECALLICIASNLVSTLCNLVWTELTYDLSYKASNEAGLNWCAHWTFMRGARKTSDAAVTKAIESGIIPLIEKIKEENGQADAGEKKEEEKPEDKKEENKEEEQQKPASNQVVPA